MSEIKKVKKPIEHLPGTVDLCEDIDKQPIAFANWYHDTLLSRTNFKLKLTPEVLQAIEDCKQQQEAILKLKVVDWQAMGDTYMTCFDI